MAQEVWKKIYSPEGILIYEGFTAGGKPSGAGTSYFANGSKHQEGVWDIKGLVSGREYYPNGRLRFEGAYVLHRAYGPNYPIYGSCYDEDGKLYYNGKLTITKGGVGYPMVEYPPQFGPVMQKNPLRPDVKMWWG